MTFNISPLMLPLLFKLKSGLKTFLHPSCSQETFPLSRGGGLPSPRGTCYLASNENETFVLEGNSQAHTSAPVVRLAIKTAGPLIDRQGGRELTLALNGLKYACAYSFLAAKLNDTPFSCQFIKPIQSLLVRDKLAPASCNALDG